MYSLLVYLYGIFACQKHSYTVCPGSSDPPEKIFNIFAAENEVYAVGCTPFNIVTIL